MSFRVHLIIPGELTKEIEKVLMNYQANVI
jgi:hypothetical protein